MFECINERDGFALILSSEMCELPNPMASDSFMILKRLHESTNILSNQRDYIIIIVNLITNISTNKTNKHTLDQNWEIEAIFDNLLIITKPYNDPNFL